MFSSLTLAMSSTLVSPVPWFMDNMLLSSMLVVAILRTILCKTQFQIIMTCLTWILKLLMMKSMGLAFNLLAISITLLVQLF